jgi:single-stranded DNA-specific DHH superfamily exonuclease
MITGGAGLTLRAEQFECFSSAFDQEVKRRIGPEDLEDALYFDGEVDADLLSLELAALLGDAGPWVRLFRSPYSTGSLGC